ncbi:MAG: family 20 glycosylhydrolase [Bacteroidales bacterium]|nr:family 20 glycosylhydrolase [Bacteroidales bacterium]
MKSYPYKQFMGACLLAGTFMLGACTHTPPVPQEVSVIPTVNQLEEMPGAFVLKRNATIGYTDPQLAPAAEYLASLLSPATGYNLQTREGEGTITLALDAAAGQAGGYRFTADEQKVSITGDSYGGVIAGISTFRQLFPPQIESREKVKGTDWVIPLVNIQDAPRYEWRGMMLDVSRHFYSKEEVMKFLDLMALYKMNKFHWHLTDDQGWRIEIKQYPLLTEKGAWRKFNSQDRECLRLAKKNDNPDMLLPDDKIRIVEGDTLYGGFYTQDDIREVVAYAGVRGIDVVPEIDMPGHMLAAVSNYEGVSCFKETGWGSTFSSPVCPGKDSALEFCKNVYSELIGLFPYTYIHIGGDEVEKTNWKKCPDCQKRMRDNGLRTEEELQAWFIHDMEHFFNEHGKQMIGWDEIIEGGLSETATVMWWRDWVKDAAAKATAHGNKVIFTPNGNFYLDYQEDKNSITNLYNFDPTAGLSAEQQALIRGVQGNIWCEWIPSNERMQYMAVPRLQAIAELGWSAATPKDLASFRARLACQLERLNLMGVNYRIPDLEGFHTLNAFIGEGTVNVTCLDPTAEIRYTTDGTTPTLQSPKYEGPLTITETTDFIFSTFRPNGKKGDTVNTRFVKSEYAPAVATASPSNPGLKAVWHEFKGNRCKDIEQAPLNGTYSVEDVMIPKKVKGNIGLIIKGYFNAPQDDIYTFALLSDDGSTLVIDGDCIVDNDGPHGPKEIVGQKALSKGYHPIEVRYFDQNGGQLKLRVTGSDGKEIPFTHLYAY